MFRGDVERKGRDYWEEFFFGILFLCFTVSFLYVREVRVSFVD